MNKKLFHDFLAKIEEDVLSSEECAMIEGGTANDMINPGCINNCNCYINSTCKSTDSTNDRCTNNCYCKEDGKPPISGS